MEKNDEKILCIDVGGSHIKATIINYDGDFLQKYEREKTPSPPSPEKVVKLILEIASRFPHFDKVTAGFPGYVKKGVVKTAPKLGNDVWRDFDLKKELQDHLKKPTLVINDADLQGLSLAEGKGVEMLITLGTGFGSAIMNDGFLMPHLEMSQHPVTKKKNYNDYVSASALEKVGKKKWNKRMKKVIEILRVVFNFDHLYISGGSAKLINFDLDDDVTIVNNREGIKGGMVLWKQFGEEDVSKNIKRMKIGIAADHGGFELKNTILQFLKEKQFEVKDFGALQLDSGDDYPDFVIPLAEAVAKKEVDRGIAVCGSGVGASVAANKVAGVRATLIHDHFSAHQGVEDDDMNLICLGGRVTAYAAAEELIMAFLNAKYVGAERFERRLQKIRKLEEKNL